MSNEDKLGVAVVKHVCVICLDEQESIIMNQELTKKNAKEIESMHNKIIGYAPELCDNCKADIEKAFMVLSFDESKSTLEEGNVNLFRTGFKVGIKKDSPFVEEFIKSTNPEAIERGYVFLPEEAMIEMGMISEETLKERKKAKSTKE